MEINEIHYDDWNREPSTEEKYETIKYYINKELPGQKNFELKVEYLYSYLFR